MGSLVGSVGYRARWVFFYFLKLLTLAGYITQPPPIIALTEVVFATASVKTTINRDL
jgi:hypothetical protein